MRYLPVIAALWVAAILVWVGMFAFFAYATS